MPPRKIKKVSLKGKEKVKDSGKSNILKECCDLVTLQLQLERSAQNEPENMAIQQQVNHNLLEVRKSLSRLHQHVHLTEIDRPNSVEMFTSQEENAIQTLRSALLSEYSIQKDFAEGSNERLKAEGRVDIALSELTDLIIKPHEADPSKRPQWMPRQYYKLDDRDNGNKRFPLTS